MAYKELSDEVKALGWLNFSQAIFSVIPNATKIELSYNFHHCFCWSPEEMMANDEGIGVKPNWTGDIANFDTAMEKDTFFRLRVTSALDKQEIWSDKLEHIFAWIEHQRKVSVAPEFLTALSEIMVAAGTEEWDYVNLEFNDLTGMDLLPLVASNQKWRDSDLNGNWGIGDFVNPDDYDIVIRVTPKYWMFETGTYENDNCMYAINLNDLFKGFECQS